MNPFEPTAKNIIHAWCARCLFDRRQTHVFPNTYMAGYEGDIIEVSKAGYLYEFEVKVTRADFFADMKKCDKYYRDNPTKHQLIASGQRVNHFAYVVPKGLVSADEVPPYAGLIYVDGIYSSTITDLKKKWDELRISVTYVKNAPKLSKEKLGKEWLSKLYQSTYMRYHARNRSEYAELIESVKPKE